MRRALVALLCSALLGSCATSRDAAELRRTPFGRMGVPAGSALAWETYTPAAWNVTGPICGRLERTYASNDTEGFKAAFDAVAIAHSARWIGARSSRPKITDPSLPGYSPGQHLVVSGTSVALDISDLDHPEGHVPGWIDARAWRYIVHLRITDASSQDGGRCS